MSRNPFSVTEIQNAQKELIRLKKISSSEWSSLAQKELLSLAILMSQKVPAYRQYLKNTKWSQKILSSTITDLPVMDKSLYLRKSSYQDLFVDNDISDITTVSATSGSSGEPFYFPRTEDNDAQYRYLAELMLVNQFGLSKTKKTLGIIGFGMGIWIGGIFTYKNFNQIAAKGYKLSLVPVGANIDLFLKSIKKLAPLYDQLIIMGYPPFIKDVVDEATRYDIDWKKHKVKVLTAAEGYSENFRDYIAKKLGLGNIFTDTVNMYGTVELGTMAHETPLSILIRRMSVDHPELFKVLFPDAHRLPTLVQYYPNIVHFSQNNGEVLASGYGSAIPLLHYRFPDQGGVITFDEMVKRFAACGYDLISLAKKVGIQQSILKLPFVYIYDRSDNALMLRGATIHSDEVKEALLHKDLQKFLTGKFTMIKNDDKKANSFLTIYVELKQKIKSSKNILERVRKCVVKTLLSKNDEYHYLYSQSPTKVLPIIHLQNNKDPKYFSGQGKQKWAI